MRRPGSPAALAAGLALLLIVNATILTAAAWNRWGGPLAELVLTERELSVPAAREEENSGLALSLVLGDEPPPVVARAAWRKRCRLPRAEHPWLDRAKLRELGFSADLDPSDPAAPDAYDAEVSRRVFVVLEFEGEAWRRWLAAQEDLLSALRRNVESGTRDRKELQDAEALLALDRMMRSRLFPVDAGTDLETLRRRYPDRARHVVVRGLIDFAVRLGEDGLPQVRSIVEVLPDRVHVPVGVRPQIVSFLPRETRAEALERERKEPEAAWPSPAPPRYRAVLAFGRRLEPWIVSVAPGGQESANSVPMLARGTIPTRSTLGG